jgi:Bifunctional DNA primase/polymerase, N-terminal
MAMDNANHTDVTNSTPDGAKTILATASGLIDRGYSPILLNGKRPYETGWQKAENKTAVALQQSYVPGNNLGIRCGKWSCPKPGHGLVVVDVDVYDRESTQEAYDKLAELTGGATGAHVISGSRKGGHHDWYACPLDKLPSGARKVIAKSDRQVEFEIDGKRKTKAAWAIEVLSTGAQGVLLNAVSCALCNRESIKLPELPRMADFAVWATAAEPALGLQPGEFMDAYNANRREAIQLNLGQDSVAEAIKSLLVLGTIRGNYKEILDELKNHVRNGSFDSLPLDFPKTPRGLANKVKRLIPALRAEGIEVKINDRSHGRNHIEIRDVKRESLENELEAQYAA